MKEKQTMQRINEKKRWVFWGVVEGINKINKPLAKLSKKRNQINKVRSCVTDLMRGNTGNRAVRRLGNVCFITSGSPKEMENKWHMDLLKIHQDETGNLNRATEREEWLKISHKWKAQGPVDSAHKWTRPSKKNTHQTSKQTNQKTQTTTTTLQISLKNRTFLTSFYNTTIIVTLKPHKDSITTAASTKL